MDEMFRAASETSSSLQASPYKFDGLNSPFATRHKLPAYEYYKANPEKGARFARAMAGVTRRKRQLQRHLKAYSLTMHAVDRQLVEVRDEFPWDTIGDGTLVDVGGGSGHIAISLAKVCSAKDLPGHR